MTSTNDIGEILTEWEKIAALVENKPSEKWLLVVLHVFLMTLALHISVTFWKGDIETSLDRLFFKKTYRK